MSEELNKEVKTVKRPVKTKAKTSFEDKFKTMGKIKVKPFVDQNKENMGLENYNMALYPGTHQEEQLAAIERNGIVTYITGLNEFAHEVQMINDDELKEATIKNIRETICYLEKVLATNVIDPEDPDFWNKVKLLRPDNLDFWSKIEIKCSNDDLVLNPAKNPYDLIKFIAIEAGGFSLVGKSYEDAAAQPVSPKFYLDKEVHSISNRTSYKKLRNQAIGLLDNIASKNVKKLLYLTKIIDSNSISYKVSTPPDVMYDTLDDYINGYGIESNKTKAAESFIDLTKLDNETLKLKAIVKDASTYKIISPKPDGHIYHSATGTMLGRNVSDVVLYLKNPLNEDVLMTLLKEVDTFWNS